MGGGKALRAFTYKVDMWRLFEDEAGGFDGVAEALDAGNATGFHASSIHEKGVELDTAVGGEKAAATGVEGGVIFEDCDCSFDGVDGRTAAREDAVASFESGADSGLMGLGIVGGDGPCAAMDEEDGIADGRSWHGVMVTQAAPLRRARRGRNQATVSPEVSWKVAAPAPPPTTKTCRWRNPVCWSRGLELFGFVGTSILGSAVTPPEGDLRLRRCGCGGCNCEGVRMNSRCERSPERSN